jgi:hypothetical protein
MPAALVREMIDYKGQEISDAANDLSAMNRRRFERVPVNLPGRYMLEDGTEYPCECLDISVTGVRLRAAVAGPWGSRVVVYIDGIGRLEGYIVRRAIGWFALEVHNTARKGERVQERIAWLLEAANIERRSPARQFVRRDVALETQDGSCRAAQLTDITREGAALLTEDAYEVGQRLRLDNRDAQVVRSFPGGVALQFDYEPRRARA